MKKTMTGTIDNRGPLQGARAEFVKRQAVSGQPLVRLLEARGAYKKGDLVQLGTGEFRVDR